MLTAKKLLERISEAITLNCQMLNLLGVPLTPGTVQVLADTALALARLNYPHILPEDGTMVTRLCGEKCKCTLLEYDDILSALLQREKENISSTFVELQNNTLQ